MNAFRTMIVPSSIVTTVRALADSFGPAAANMWTTPLSPTGELPVTHWISTGQIGDDFAAIMPFGHDVDGKWVVDPYDPAAFVALAEANGVTAPPAKQISALMAVVDVSDQEPFTAMDRLGLQLCTPPLA